MSCELRLQISVFMINFDLNGKKTSDIIFIILLPFDIRQKYLLISRSWVDFRTPHRVNCFWLMILKRKIGDVFLLWRPCLVAHSKSYCSSKNELNNIMHGTIIQSFLVLVVRTETDLLHYFTYFQDSIIHKQYYDKFNRFVMLFKWIEKICG